MCIGMDESPKLDEVQFREINLIQDVIKRMANNSFLIKGWAVTLVVITMLLRGTNTQILIAFIPVIAFWILDAYYVRQERMYRELYKWVITNRLSSNEHMYDLNARRFENDVDSIPATMISITLLCFYGTILLILAASVAVLYILPAPTAQMIINATGGF